MFLIFVSVPTEGSYYDIDEISIHPDYSGLAYNDVAVIKLKPGELYFINKRKTI